MNWGWKIVIFYSAFVAMILGMVFYFMGHKVDLVADDYYKQEIEYQGQIDKMTNARSLNQPIDLEYLTSDRMIRLRFPVEQIQTGIRGKIHLYRPSDSSLDKLFEVKPDSSGVQNISVGSLNRGLWKVKISWSSDGVDFYDEKVITL